MATRDEMMQVVDELTIGLLGKELRPEVDKSVPGPERLRRRQIAAVEICRRSGILDEIKAISAGGELCPPPHWPNSDIVPVGGGSGFLDTEVRTMTDRGVIRVTARLAIGPDKKLNRDAIGAAWERGKWELRKLIAR